MIPSDSKRSKMIQLVPMNKSDIHEGDSPLELQE